MLRRGVGADIGSGWTPPRWGRTERREKNTAGRNALTIRPLLNRFPSRWRISMSDNLTPPVPFAPPAWPAGAWNLPTENAQFRRDGAAAFALLRLRHLGWQATPPAPPDVDAIMPAVGRQLQDSADWQHFHRCRCDLSAAKRAARIAQRDLK